MSRLYRWPTVLILSTGLVLLSQKFNIPVVSPLLMAWFLLVCPGLAIVGLLPVKQMSMQIGLTFALSMAVNTILAEIMAFAHLWSPNGALFLLVCLTVGCAILQWRHSSLKAPTPHGRNVLANQWRPESLPLNHATPPLLKQEQVDHVAFVYRPVEQVKATPSDAHLHFVEQMYTLTRRNLAFNRSGEKIEHQNLQSGR